MKYLLGYSIWNKVDMLSWLMEGAVNNFSPQDTELAFHFDSCSDGSTEAFDTMVDYWLILRGGWKHEQIHKLISTTETREVGGHNRLIDLFLTLNADILIVAQDDQHFLKPVTPCLDALYAALAPLGPPLGIVGGRDAYDRGYANFTGSKWSESAVQRRVEHGEFVALPHMNSGPVCYTRAVIEKVGKLDEGFRAYYVWDDYGERARKAGFVNGVMGMDLIHAKFGRMKATEWCDYSGQDRARITTKHGF